ncbi:MAG: hypothetical protein IPP57_11125 [Candidatus Obscuribacter sp.]|nr:hypothetical protein [Candidatus Obscuribacter sp.]
MTTNTTTEDRVKAAPSAGSDAPPQAPTRAPLTVGKVFARTIATAACIALATLSVEAIFAITDLGNEEFVSPDPLFGVSLIKGKSVTFRSEGFSRSKISSIGLRDVEHTVAKPAGVSRIAFLGDSKTEAMQVPLNETFVKIVEDQLNKKEQTIAQTPAQKSDTPAVPATTAVPAATAKYETINFATSGNGTLVELLHYIHTVKTYKPDTVVLIYNYGDSGDNGQNGAASSLLARPSASFDKDGHLNVSYQLLDNWFASDTTRFKVASAWLRSHSRIFQLGTDLDLSLRGDSKGYAAFSDAVIKPACMAIGKALVAPGKGMTEVANKAQAERDYLISEVTRLDKAVPRTPIVAPRPDSLNLHAASVESAGFAAVDTMYRQNMELTGRLVELLNQACKENGTKFVVVTLPAPDNSTFYFWEVRALQKLGERQGFNVVDCNKDFPKIAAMEANPYYYSAHLATPGHKLVAKIITEALTSPTPATTPATTTAATTSKPLTQKP